MTIYVRHWKNVSVTTMKKTVSWSHDKTVLKNIKTMKIKYAIISKAGRRSYNEDTFRVIDTAEKERVFAIVCDGMGGHSCGKEASETVCDAITDFWEKHSDTPDCDSKIKLACKKASNAINRKSEELNCSEMGTTMVMASIEGDKLTVAHVGDSRCYLHRPFDGLLYQTEDHVRLDFGWEVVVRSFFSFRPEIAVPDIRQFALEAGDRLLLCSDGVYKSMKPDFLQAWMTEDAPLEEVLEKLDSHCQNYGDDNYTAVLMEVKQ